MNPDCSTVPVLLFPYHPCIRHMALLCLENNAGHIVIANRKTCACLSYSLCMKGMMTKVNI